jgi:hypothetical protein
MPNPYPQPFDHADFPAIAGPTLPPLPDPRPVHAPTNEGGSLQPQSRAWIRSVTLRGAGAAPSESFANYGGHSDPNPAIGDPDDDQHYHFVPGVDDVTIRCDIVHRSRVRRNALARAVCFHHLGQLRDRSIAALQHRASWLTLVTAAIALRNTVYLSRALDAVRRRGEIVPNAVLAHLAPLG